MTFSAADAAFEGFRITRRHPGGVLAWAGVMLVGNLLSGWAIGAIAGADWAAFETLASATPPDPVKLAALLPRVAPAGLISMAVQMVAAAVVNASILRTLLRPERKVSLGFGRDELRVLGLFIAFFAISFLATLGLSAILGVLGLATGGRTAGLVTIASVAASILLFIRFALAGPMTIAEHRFRFRESWPMTRGWFWILLGSEALGAALCAVVAMLAMTIFVATAAAIVTATGGNPLTDLQGIFAPDFSSPAKLFAWPPLLSTAYVSVLYALLLVIVIGPSVELYRHLTRNRAPAPVEPNWPRLPT